MKTFTCCQWLVKALALFMAISLSHCQSNDVVQAPSLLNFAESTGTVNENDSPGIVVQIPYSTQASGTGVITVKVNPDSAVYGVNFTTVPAATNNLITINVAQKETSGSFTVLPIDNKLFTGNFNLKFSIDTVNGVLKKGSNLNYSLTLVDDEKPSMANFDITLYGTGKASGYIKFRQPVDDKLIIYLDTWVRNLEPNTDYSLQRAVDTTLDGNCTGTMWLTLGLGLQAQTITTDANGTGKVELFRDVSTIPVGMAFDIHFQIIKASTSAVVLTSDCYRYAVSQ